MGFLRFVLGTVATIVAFVVAIKIIGIVLAVAGFIMKLVWLAIVIGIFALVAWGIYKLMSPRGAEQT